MKMNWSIKTLCQQCTWPDIGVAAAQHLALNLLLPLRCRNTSLQWSCGFLDSWNLSWGVFGAHLVKTPGVTPQKKLFGILRTSCKIVATVKILQLLWQCLCDWICSLSPRMHSLRRRSRGGPAVWRNASICSESL